MIVMPSTVTMKWTTYPAYRDSGIAWLGNVPEHWEYRKLGYLTHIVSGSTPSTERLDYWNGSIPWVSSKDMKSRELFDSEDHVSDLAIQQSGLALLSPPVVLIVARGMILSHSFPVAVTRVPLTINQDLKALRLQSKCLPEFLVYLFEGTGPALRLLIEEASHGTKRLRTEYLKKHPIFLPPLPEQRAIVAFLDRETARIDALVAKKQRLIALLREKRAALISHAVTRGLDPAAPLRDSGIPWLGQIPAQWGAARLKHVARLESGHTPSRQHAEYWVDCTIPWVSLSDVGGFRSGLGIYIDDTREKISELGLANSAARLLPANTVILSRTASVGFSAIISQPMATTQDFANWICGPTLRPHYLLYCLRSMKQEFERITMGSTHQTIYMPDIGRLSVPVPPVDEQDAIVKHVERHAQKLDALVAKIEQHIATLREHRTALISAAVTGKIDVRGAVAIDEKTP